jgi:glycosyltransferase involved in cell wall biosynthesis
LVYQSALPVGLAAWVIGLVRRIPIVLDVVDLWPESVVASGMITNRWILATIRSVARFVYRRAARINVITEGYRDNLIRLGVPADRINVVHCWPGGGKCDPVEPDPEFARQCGLDKKCNILFAGNIGPCQQLETVIGAAELLYDTPHVQFVIAGGGVEYSRLEELVRQRSIGNVVFLGWRSPSDVAQLYAHSDLLLVHLRSDPMSMISIPSKTFAYMASGRPLLMAVEGEAAELVMRHECGIVAKPSDPAALAAAVREFLGMPGKLRRHMGCAAREAYLQHYSSTAQVAKVIATVDLAVGKRLAA